MSLPSILITTYHEAFLHRGGGEFEIALISNALKKHGVIADIYGPYSQDINRYDVILHFSVERGGLDLLRQIKRHNKPIVLSPNIFLQQSSSQLSEIVSEFLELSDLVTFKSISEKNDFNKYFDLHEERVRLVPQFVDSDIVMPAPKGLFSSLYGVENYAIGVGIIEPGKNQLMAIRAAKKAGIPLVLVGNYRDAEYYRKCVDEAPDNTHFITSLPYHSEIIRSALQDSSVYIEVTPEPAGFSAIEAGLSGCNLVLADSEWSTEHFGKLATYVNPMSVESISKGMMAASERRESLKDLQSLLKHHLHEHNIKILFDVLLEAYHNNQHKTLL